MLKRFHCRNFWRRIELFLSLATLALICVKVSRRERRAYLDNLSSQSLLYPLLYLAICLLVVARSGPGRKEARLRQRLSSQGREENCSHHLTITYHGI